MPPPAGPDAGHPVPSVEGRRDRLRPGIQPTLVGQRHFGQQRVGDLRAEGVGMVKLHHPPSGPLPTAARPDVTVHRRNPMTPPSQSGTHEQTGRACTDDGDIQSDSLDGDTSSSQETVTSTPRSVK